MTVSVCIGSSCHLMGSRHVVETFQDLLARDDLNDQVELGGSLCMGRCYEGICVLIDGEFYSVNPDNAEEFYEKKIKARISK